MAAAAAAVAPMAALEFMPDLLLGLPSQVGGGRSSGTNAGPHSAAATWAVTATLLAAARSPASANGTGDGEAEGPGHSATP